jgi:hypothetical protein
MVARRHDVSAAYCRDLREFLQQFDTGLRDKLTNNPDSLKR